MIKRYLFLIRCLLIKKKTRFFATFIQLKAKFTGKRFYCYALSGKSGYNISINCDMTVSCNCQDWDNSGCLGDLSTQSLDEIFRGANAQEKRDKLARGILPLLICTECKELRWVDKDKVLYYRNHYVIPKAMMLENTVECPLSCRGCDRSKVLNVRKKRKLTLEDIKKISQLLKKHQIGRICYFKLGDPFYSSVIHEELKVIKEDNPNIEITISTNGIGLDSDKKREAALMTNRIIFSIDGPNDRILRKYQEKGSFVRSYKNMEELLRFRDARGPSEPIIEWKYVLFNWNDKKHMISEAIELAKQSGVDVISFWFTTWPRYGISWRYCITNFFKTIGSERQPGVREVRLR